MAVITDRPHTALESLNRRAFANVQEIYKELSPILENHPDAFPKGWKPHNVFQLMQQRGWLQPNGKKPSFMVVLKGKPAPLDLSDLNDLDVIPPRAPTY